MWRWQWRTQFNGEQGGGAGLMVGNLDNPKGLFPS